MLTASIYYIKIDIEIDFDWISSCTTLVRTVLKRHAEINTCTTTPKIRKPANNVKQFFEIRYLSEIVVSNVTGRKWGRDKWTSHDW
jgi:hypothetical protein